MKVPIIFFYKVPPMKFFSGVESVVSDKPDILNSSTINFATVSNIKVWFQLNGVQLALSPKVIISQALNNCIVNFYILDLEKAFHSVDQDQDGFIDSKELEELANSVKLNLQLKDCEEIIKKCGSREQIINKIISKYWSLN